MNTLTQEQKNKVSALINDLAEMFKPMVKEIEGGIAITKDNYGRYGALISQLSKGNAGTAKLMAASLIKAGANAAGVTNGLNLLVLGTGYGQ
jgi:succinyl-CoA synthetase alpha subunit